MDTDYRKLPASLTPLNIHAWLHHALGCCGCMGSAPLEELERLLEWMKQGPGSGRPSFESLYPAEGAYYLMVGLLEGLDLSEHGVSARHPWLTTDGERLYLALQEMEWEEIEGATGEAYDGCWYGDLSEAF